MSTVPQWNADIVTPSDNVDVAANGGLGLNEGGALEVKVDNETIVIDQDGELKATLSDRDSAYVATYGTTTYQELSSAKAAGKAIFVTGVSGALSAVLPMTSFSTNPAMVMFSSVIAGSEYRAKIDQDVWSSTTVSTQADWNESNQVAPSYIANKPTVDQIYDSTSTNAQSGTAVAGALATLPKFNIFKGKFAPGTSPSMNSNSKYIHYWKDTTSTDNIWVFLFGGNLSSAFRGNSNLLEIIEASVSFATLANQMFYGCSSLTSVPLFDTSNVTNMSSMFTGCSSLTSVPLFDTSSATNMSSMFTSDYNAGAVPACTSLTSVPLFDTSNVTNMSNMFNGCTALTSVPLFDTSSVTNMSYTFSGCTALTSVPLFDTSIVTNMSYTFSGCTALTSVPLFDTPIVTNMSSMFIGCSSLTSVPLFDTSSVTNMTNMFKDCTAVESGALALYNQASTQTTPPSNHSGTFTNCGSNTVSGAAELAQIPTSWGGTMA